MPNKISQFWQELKRRRVIHVIVVYASAAFVIIELVNNVYETLNLPEWTPAFTLIILSIGFPLAIIFSWIYERSSKGLVKTRSIETSKVQKEQGIPSEKTIIPEKSIIVLPFENISPDPDQEYFSDGLTEEIITDLSYIDDLLVISRSSAMTFKGTSKKINEIAREVNVQYVLEGSVRKEGRKLKIVAQLIDAERDIHLWAGKYSGTLDDVFEIQEKVSESITNTLKIKLSQTEKDLISEKDIDDIQTYEYYFKAKHTLVNWNLAELEQAEQLLHKGIEIAGRNVLLFSQLGHINYQYWNLGYSSDESSLQKAAEYADKIFETDPDSIHGLFLKGTLEMAGGHATESIRYFRRVLKVNPNHTDALFWISIYLAFNGKAELADPFIERVSKIDPLNLAIPFLHLWKEIYRGRFRDSLQAIKKLPESHTDFIGIIWLRVLANAYLSRKQEALANVERFRKNFPENLRYNNLFDLLESALKKSGLTDLSVDPELRKWARKDTSYALFLAECYSLLGLKDPALEWLETSINLGGINYPFLNDYNTLLENIRGEERFKKLMERVKHEWENFEV